MTDFLQNECKFEITTRFHCRHLRAIYQCGHSCYSKFCKLIKKIREIIKNLKFQDRKINDEVDTLLRKLDEFEQLLVLSHSDANVCLFKHVPGLQSKLSEMQDVFDKVDRLEFMVAKIKQDMDQLDRQLTQAESTVETSAPGLKSIVPFIFVRISIAHHSVEIS